MALSTRDQLILAAERIGAEEGFGAMSLRAVQQAAAQRNKSAAHYHFGSRAGLVEAVIETRMGPINEHRTRLLDALAPDADLAAVVEVLVRPLAEAVLDSPSSHWARFVLHGFADPSVSEVVSTNMEGHAYRAVRAELQARLDFLPPALRRRRVDHAVSLLVVSLAGAETARGMGLTDVLSARANVAELVALCTALLTAPVPPEAEAELLATTAT